MPDLKVGGFTGITTIDFPGQLASVVFCQGCPWRCAYCHNPHLLDKEGETLLEWSGISSFMESRRGLLDGIVFSGGEPTAQPGLLNAVQEMREKGFLVGLHTAGPHPDRLGELLPLLNWVAMDIKAPFDSYEKITMSGNSGKKAKQSAQLVLDSGLPYEFRTTVYTETLDDASVMKMAAELRNMGVKNYVLQKYRSQSNQLESGAFVSQKVTKSIETYFETFELRQ